MTQKLLDRSNSFAPLEKGEQALWLHNERDNRFGEVLQVIRVNGNKVDYFFPDRPTWKTCLSPSDMILAKKTYTLEEVKRIKSEEARKRRRYSSIIYILIFITCLLQWGVLNSIREIVAGR